jgi:adenylate cyclase
MIAACWYHKVLTDFSTLVQLRVLGLMDVTTTRKSGTWNIRAVRRLRCPHDNLRVHRMRAKIGAFRTSVLVVNKMAYGITDNLGRDDSPKMLDPVQPESIEKKDETIFALFGALPTAGHNVLNRFLHDHFLTVFSSQLTALDARKNETVPDAIRRSFLKLNKLLYDELYSPSSAGRQLSQASGSMVGKILGLEGSSLRCGASSIALYLVDKTLYVANAGDAF